MIPRVEELTDPPVDGKYYLVPCVEVSCGVYRSDRQPRMWPVMGPRHEDTEIINFPVQHWHYDRRFLSTVQFLAVGKHYGSVLNSNRSADEGARSIEGVGSLPVIIKRRCMRAEPGFPQDGRAGYLPALRAAYREKTVTCGKCPHRGVPLSSLPREPGTDIVTCPGHGLRWDLSNGELVR